LKKLVVWSSGGDFAWLLTKDSDSAHIDHHSRLLFAKAPCKNDFASLRIILWPMKNNRCILNRWHVGKRNLTKWWISHLQKGNNVFPLCWRIVSLK
jgi:hypothetical protein